MPLFNTIFYTVQRDHIDNHHRSNSELICDKK